LRIIGILLALVFAVSLVLPTVALAADPTYAGLANCAWDPVKWEGNPNSWGLYLQHWGRTPIQAMTRLSGLCGPKALCADLGTNCPAINACLGGCPACRDVEPGALATCSSAADCTASLTASACDATGQTAYSCPPTSVVTDVPVLDLPHCGFCWGVSLALAEKSWAGADIGGATSTNASLNNNHPNHLGTSCDNANPNHGGDWGVTGAPHTECCALTWALQDNCFGYEGSCK
jgi:hypothetical protein